MYNVRYGRNSLFRFDLKSKTYFILNGKIAISILLIDRQRNPFYIIVKFTRKFDFLNIQLISMKSLILIKVHFINSVRE